MAARFRYKNPNSLSAFVELSPGSASAEPRIPQAFDAPAEEEEEEKPLKRLGEMIESLTGVDEVKQDTAASRGSSVFGAGRRPV